MLISSILAHASTTRPLGGDLETNLVDPSTTVSAHSGEPTVSALSGEPAVSALSGEPAVSALSGESAVSAHSGEPAVSAHSGEPAVSAYSGEPAVSAYSGEPAVSAYSGEPAVSAHSGEDDVRTNMFKFSSIVLRRLGKVIATFNAIWIVVTCIFQFSNFFSRCFCNSSVFGLGQNAYNVIILTAGDIPGMRNVWTGAVSLLPLGRCIYLYCFCQCTLLTHLCLLNFHFVAVCNNFLILLYLFARFFCVHCCHVISYKRSSSATCLQIVQ